MNENLDLFLSLEPEKRLEILSALAADINQMSHLERDRLLLQLLDKNRLGLELDEPGYVAVPIASHVDVKPGENTGVSTNNYIADIQVTRIVILEPEYEMIDHESRHTMIEPKVIEVVGFWPWKKKWIEKRPKFETVERDTPNLCKIPRGAWDVNGVFFGSQNAFPNASGPALCGDSFTPDMKSFTDVIWNIGLPATMNVQHRMKKPAPFRAIVVGKKQEKKKKPGTSERKGE